MDFDESVFWPVARAAGMLTAAQWAADGCPPKTVYVDYRAPTVDFLGQRSSQHSIEFQAADMPTLAEGQEIILSLAAGDTLFRVREADAVPELGATGYFRTALLTQV